MAQYGAQKNPPWVRDGSLAQPGITVVGGLGQPVPVATPTVYSLATPQMTTGQPQYTMSMTNQLQPGMGIPQMLNINQGAVQLPQPGIAIPTTLATSQMSQVQNVSYPTPRTQLHQPAPGASQPKQRVFTGTVTKLHDSFGFVDEDVFFQTSCVKGSLPKVGDRVLVEASYNANMPFKWNATRIQVLPQQKPPQQQQQPPPNIVQGFNPSKPPPNLQPPQFNQPPPPLMSQTTQPPPNMRGGVQVPPPGSRRLDPPSYDRGGGRSSDHRGGERNERRSSPPRRQRSPPRKRSRSPRRRSRSPAPRRVSPVRRSRPVRVAPRYLVQVPKISLDTKEANVIAVKCRYTNMYIPSDFFHTTFSWVDAFPLHRPFELGKQCTYHVMHKEVDPTVRNDAVFEPPDADHLYSAKVMLSASPTIEDLYKKSCSFVEDSTDNRDNLVHPTRLMNFLVGLKGKEPMAIGGPWSPSLDGAQPADDPRVLINTAIRTTRALTGIDLAGVTQWYRFAEIHYHRPEEVHKGRVVPARVETVVLFLPDVWSCNPSRIEWDGLAKAYKTQLADKYKEDDAAAGTTTQEADTQDDEEEEGEANGEVKDPTHHSELDPKTMKVNDLRKELEARTLSSKGLKSQLIARLTKAIKTEVEKEEEEAENKDDDENEEGGALSPTMFTDVIDDLVKESEDKNVGKCSDFTTSEKASAKEPEPQAEKDKNEDKEKEDEKKKREEEDKKRREERERAVRERRYTLPDTPAILVHPSTTAKSGKFDCTMMSLSVLLDYRPDDNKEHTFEVSLFAELFNEMLMRDFGFRIYKSLVTAPEKVKDEDKKDKDKKKEKDKRDSKHKDSSSSSKDKDKDDKDKERDSKDRDKDSKDKEKDGKDGKDKESKDEKDSKVDKEKDSKEKEDKEDTAEKSTKDENEEKDKKEASAKTEDNSEEPPAKKKKEDDSKDKDRKERKDSSDKKDDKMESKDKKRDRDSSGKKDDKKKDEKKDEKERKSKDRDDDDEEDKKSVRSEEKKRERVKMVTADPGLLLAFNYFDLSHTGYVVDKDMEEILHTIGLQLSRAQVRKVVAKCVSKDQISYHKLTDLPADSKKEEDKDKDGKSAEKKEVESGTGKATTPKGKATSPTKSEEQVMETDAMDDETLAKGNKPLLPLFNTNLKGESPSKRGARSGKKDADAGNMIMYKGSMLDIPSMVGRVEKSEKLKRETDTKLKDLQEEMDMLKDSCKSSEQTSQKVALELQELKKKLRDQRKATDRSESDAKKYYEVLSNFKSTLSSMQSSIHDVTGGDKKHSSSSSGGDSSSTKTEIKQEVNGES